MRQPLTSTPVSLQARIDHKAGTVHFGGLEVESDTLRGHIASLARNLRQALQMIQPETSPDQDARRLQVRFHQRYSIPLECSILQLARTSRNPALHRS